MLGIICLAIRQKIPNIIKAKQIYIKLQMKYILYIVIVNIMFLNNKIIKYSYLKKIYKNLIKILYKYK